jgi:hypothetical protein
MPGARFDPHDETGVELGHAGAGVVSPAVSATTPGV